MGLGWVDEDSSDDSGWIPRGTVGGVDPARFCAVPVLRGCATTVTTTVGPYGEQSVGWWRTRWFEAPWLRVCAETTVTTTLGSQWERSVGWVRTGAGRYDNGDDNG